MNAYEEATKRAGKKYNEHIEIAYTGEGNVHALRLDKLKKKRRSRCRKISCGIMMILGVLSGDKGLTASGLATNGAGRITRNINDDRTMDTQTEMQTELWRLPM